MWSTVFAVLQRCSSSSTTRGLRDGRLSSRRRAPLARLAAVWAPRGRGVHRRLRVLARPRADARRRAAARRVRVSSAGAHGGSCRHTGRPSSSRCRSRHLLRQDLGPRDVSKAVGVHGLLVQDVVGSETPNGALWSIAVEWQIYFVFPLILLVAEGSGARAAVPHRRACRRTHGRGAGTRQQDRRPHAAVPRPVRARAPRRQAGQGGEHATCCGAGAPRRRPRRVVAARPQGSEWMVAHFFWVDLLFGLGVACALEAAYTPAAPDGARVLGLAQDLPRAVLVQHLPDPRPDRRRARQVRVGPLGIRRSPRSRAARDRAAPGAGALLRLPSDVRGAVPAAPRRPRLPRDPRRAHLPARAEVRPRSLRRRLPWHAGMERD